MASYVLLPILGSVDLSYERTIVHKWPVGMAVVVNVEE